LYEFDGFKRGRGEEGKRGARREEREEGRVSSVLNSEKRRGKGRAGQVERGHLGSI
jgi:hypothetical protein